MWLYSNDIIVTAINITKLRVGARARGIKLHRSLDSNRKCVASKFQW